MASGVIRMSDLPVPTTPNEELASVIAEKLVAAGLVPKSREAELQAKLSTGKAKASDWPVWTVASAPRKDEDDHA